MKNEGIKKIRSSERARKAKNFKDFIVLDEETMESIGKCVLENRKEKGNKKTENKQNKETKEEKKCNTCNGTKGELICDKCEEKICQKCEKLDLTIVKAIEKEKKEVNNMKWNCNNCKEQTTEENTHKQIQEEKENTKEEKECEKCKGNLYLQYNFCAEWNYTKCRELDKKIVMRNKWRDRRAYF